MAELDLLLGLSLRILLIVCRSWSIRVSKNAIHEAHLVLSRVIVGRLGGPTLTVSGELLLDPCLVHSDTICLFILVAKLAPSWQVRPRIGIVVKRRWMLSLLLRSPCHSLCTMVVVVLVDIVHGTWGDVADLATNLWVALNLTVVDRVTLRSWSWLSLTEVGGIDLVASSCGLGLDHGSRSDIRCSLLLCKL